MRTLILLATFLVFVLLITGCVHTYVNSGEGNEAGPDIEKTIDTKIQSTIDAKITGVNKGDTKDVKVIKGGAQ